MAVELPSRVRRAIQAVVEAMRDRAPTARWTPIENVHVTLRFLGAVGDERVPAVSECVAAAVAEMVDFSVSVAAPGAFPSPERTRVLWVGLHDPVRGLAALASALDEHLEPLGFETERRPFRAHVTVARLPVPAAVDLAGIDVEQVALHVDRVSLMQSHLGGNKPARYEALATYPFRREAGRPRPDGDA